MKKTLQQFQNAILESFPVAIVTMDRNLKITSFNAKAEELTGLSAREVIGHACRDILNSSRCSYACPLETDSEIDEKTGLEAEIINRYGEHIPVRIGTATLKGENGDYMGHLEIIEDISREKELEREKENFQFMVVHDMKSPLVALLGLAERLQQHHDEMDKEKLERYLQSIHKTGEQLESQITEFLEYCREATGKLKLNFQDTDIAEILNNLLERHGDRAEEKSITLHGDLKTRSSITGDPKHLQRVFENLLDNAIKFSEEGSEITLRARETDREIIVQVRDQGPGIPLEDMPYIFDAFHQAKSKQGSSGHGLGLAAVRTIVREHAGRVSVKNNRDQGTTFTVRLPKNSNEINDEATG